MIRPCILRAFITVLFLCPSFVFAATGDTPCKIPDQFLNERPDPEGVPTRVNVGLYLVHITEIKSKKQIFTVDLALFLNWKDPRLAGDSSGISFASRKLKPAQVWNPGVIFRNAMDIKRTFVSLRVSGLIAEITCLYLPDYSKMTATDCSRGAFSILALMAYKKVKGKGVNRRWNAKPLERVIFGISSMG